MATSNAYWGGQKQKASEEESVCVHMVRASMLLQLSAEKPVTSLALRIPQLVASVWIMQ
jgi:hypothetical protein